MISRFLTLFFFLDLFTFLVCEKKYFELILCADFHFWFLRTQPDKENRQNRESFAKIIMIDIIQDHNFRKLDK